MFVVIPHKSAQLMLVRAQKRMLAVLNEQNRTRTALWHPVFPLWITFDDKMTFADFDTVQNMFEHILSDKTRSDNVPRALTICAPQIAAAELIFPATMQLKNKNIISGKITAGVQRQKSYDEQIFAAHAASAEATRNETAHGADAYSSAIDAAHVIATAELPISCTVFRMACAQIVEDAHHVRTWRVKKSRWVKCLLDA
ncbi:MAG: hypothetical protein IJR50_07940 [Treponema sp.]|nr:hypothetical protein [Treponema sp.]